MALSSLARRLAPAARPVWVVLGILAVAAVGHGLGARELSLLNRTELVFWLGLPGALAGCAGVCVSLTGERAAAALLAAVALVASLAFGELGLTAKAFLGAAGGRGAGGPGAADALAAARTAGRELVPSLSLMPVFRGAGPGRLVSRLAGEQGELLPLGGIANAETIYCRRDGRWLSYRSDEQGFRNPPGSWAALPAAAILLGDSFVQGHCVGDDAELGQRLRARLGRVINLGIGGRGPLFQLAALAEYGPLLRPRLVLWFFVEGDDVEDDLAHERQSALLLSYLQPGFRQELLARSPEVGAALVALGEQARATPFKDDGGALTAFRHALTLSQTALPRRTRLAGAQAGRLPAVPPCVGTGTPDRWRVGRHGRSRQPCATAGLRPQAAGRCQPGTPGAGAGARPSVDRSGRAVPRLWAR